MLMLDAVGVFLRRSCDALLQSCFPAGARWRSGCGAAGWPATADEIGGGGAGVGGDGKE